ncbi:MAG: T6SS effector BTH_I2691 family protein [Pseudomonadota bacterium]
MSPIPDINKAVTAAINNLPSSGAGTSPESGGCSNCPMCKKSPGLVILPVRYSAIAESEAHGIHGLNPISDGDPFGEGVLDKPLKHARYILRCMRPGYFYLHFPSGDADGVTWRKYRVTSDSNFIPVPLDGQSAHGMEMSEACRSSSDWQMARCVTICQPEKITEAWLAFSDTNWDSTLRDRIAQDPAFRMQSLNPSACLSDGSGQPHTAPLSEVTDWVSEYRHNTLQSFRHTVADQDDAENIATFESVYPFHWRAFEAEHLLETADRTSPGRSIIFAAHDPRGITVELNAEQIQAVEASLQRHSWVISSTHGINSIRAAVEGDAERSYRDSILGRVQTSLEYTNDQLEDVNRQIESGNRSAERLAYKTRLEENRTIIEARIERMEEERIDEGRINRIRRKAWRDTRDGSAYLSRSDEDIEQEYKQALGDIQGDTETCSDLISIDHASWLKSDSLAGVFRMDYLTNQLDSGINYVDDFVECIQDAADRQECADILREWAAAGDLNDISNPLLRSLGHNQDDHLAAINNTAPLTIESAVSVLGKFNGAWQKSASAMLNPEASEAAGRNAFSRLIYHSGAPIANMLSNGVDNTAKNIYLMASMFSTDQWIVERPIKGTSGQFISLLADEMRQAIPANKRPSRGQMQHALRGMLKRTGQYAQLDTQHFVFVDGARLRTISDGKGSGRSTAERLLRSREPIVLTPGNIREGIMPGFRQAVSGEVRMQAVSLLFASISWHYAGKALDNADAFSRRELSVKFWAAIAGVVGGLCETVETAVNGLAEAGRKFSNRTLNISSKIGVFGRALGAGVAFVFAIYDVVHAYEAGNKGNVGLVMLYGLSAVGNVALGAIALAAGIFSLVGIVVILAMLAINLLIGMLVDSDAQKWLSHCFFGEGERFPTIKESQKSLKSVLGG